MSELERWAQRSAPLMSSREEREGKRAAVAIVTEAKLAALQVDVESAVTERVMDRATALDQHRKALAGDDPLLNELLKRIEFQFVLKGQAHVRNLNDGFRL